MNTVNDNKKIRGIMPALVTPLCEDRVSLNTSALRKLIEYHKSQGADGFYISGATGEGLLLGMETKKKLFEESVNAIGADKKKIIHITDMNFENTKYLARYAEDCGADAISAIPPIYFGYNSDDIYNYYKEIAEQVNIPVMLYYTPAANTILSTELFLRLSEIDNITSVKWTMKDYFKMIQLISETNGKMTVINGPDEMLLCGLSAGASGGIGTTYNVMLPLYKKIYELFNEGKMQEALEVQKKADKVISAMSKFSAIIPVVKVILEDMGFEVGMASKPLRTFSNETRKQIIADVKAAGLNY